MNSSPGKYSKIKGVLSGILLVFLLVQAKTSPAEGNGSNAINSDMIVLPFVYYTPETRTAFVLTGIYTSREQSKGSKPSSLMGFLTYTLENQGLIQFFPQVYTSSGVRIVGGAVVMDFPEKLYGIGLETNADAEEEFTKAGFILDAAVQFEVLPGFFAGIRFDHQDLNVEDMEPGGLLETGSVPGSDGGAVSGAGLLITYDSRDDIFTPSRGFYGEVSAMTYNSGTGSDFDFDTLTLDLRQFLTPGSFTLAFQEYLHLSGGDPPFFRLAELGGNWLMRGYFRGRFRDRNMAVVQAESRIPLSSKFGLVIFGSAGTVSGTPGDLMENPCLSALGTGLRYRIGKKESINLRGDLAWGEDGNNGVYFMIREAF